MTVVVEVTRGGVVESVHHGRMLVIDADGRDVLRIGDIATPIFPRSSNKPLQAVGMLRQGVDVSTQALALAAASHNGDPQHVAVARDRLAASGLRVEDLGCPPDWPLNEDAREAVIRAGEPKSPVYMNCSGKHALMLATAVAVGAPTADYLAVDHPVQTAIAEAVADTAGERPAATAVDGCGAPLLALTPHGLARAFLRLAAATDGAEAAVARAMRQHPGLVGGEDRAVTKLLRGVPGLVGKDGAEGVFVAAVPDAGAVVVKIDDGAGRANLAPLVAGLRALGVQAAVLDDLATSPVLGGGRPVGEIRVNPEAFAAAAGQTG